MKKLVSYFSNDVSSVDFGSIGMEVETQFLTGAGDPISVDTSQKMFRGLVENNWKIKTTKGKLITCIEDAKGNTFSYELGRHNIELSGASTRIYDVLENSNRCLGQLYLVGEKLGAYPMFEPVLRLEEDLLVIPDERDAVWLGLDGRSALAPLARTSSIQFTIAVSVDNSIKFLNKLGENIDWFLKDYPQEIVWRKYIQDSLAGYREDRYGGPLVFDSIEDYCEKLTKQDVVSGAKLIPYNLIDDLDVPLFLRSIWWYFRLKRYGDSLCIEVRPMPRRDDSTFGWYLNKALEILRS